MAGEFAVTWPVEEIPNSDRLFLRVHRDQIKRNGTPATVAFQNRGTHMSTDWEKYRTAQQTQHDGRQPAANYGVVAMIAGSVRQVPGQEVIHDPIWPTNRAHAGVTGEKTPEVRVKLRRLANWVIPLESPV